MTSSTEQKAPAVPGVPLAALNAITDPNVRGVLRALVDGYAVRNGHVGTGDERFVTAREIGLVKGRTALPGAGSGGGGGGQGASGGGKLSSGDIDRMIADLQSQIMESSLFKQLGERVGLIDENVTREVAERIAALAAQAHATTSQIQAAAQQSANDLLAAIGDVLGQLGDTNTKIDQTKQTLETADSALAQQITLVGAKTDANAAAIQSETTARTDAVSAQAQRIDTVVAQASANAAAIQTESTVRADAISAEAQQRTILAARVSGAESSLVTVTQATQDLASKSDSLTTRVGTAESHLTTLDQTTASQAQSIASLGTRTTNAESTITTLNQTTAQQATSLTQLTTRVGTNESSIGQLQTTASGQATSITSLTTRMGTAETQAASETTARTSSDNALGNAINTIWAAVGNGSALVQTGSSVTAGTGGTTASAWNQVQAAVKDASGNIISSAAIKQTTDTLVNKQGQIEAKWIVNLDAGGAATGFRQAGFGIAGSSTENGVTYSFGVRADTFWIAAPNQAAQAGAPPAQVPFIVQTGQWVDSEGYTQGAGVYLNSLFATTAKIGVGQIKTAHIGNAQIVSAHIGDAQVDTLKIGLDAVTVPVVSTAADRQRRGIGENNYTVVNEGYISMVQTGLLYVLVTSAQGFYNNTRPWRLRIKINGAVVRSIMGGVANDAPVFSASTSVPAGVSHVEVEWAAHSDVILGYNEIFMMGVKR